MHSLSSKNGLCKAILPVQRLKTPTRSRMEPPRTLQVIDLQGFLLPAWPACLRWGDSLVFAAPRQALRASPRPHQPDAGRGAAVLAQQGAGAVGGA